MCGRYVTPDERAMENYFHVGRHNWNTWATRYNVGPTMPVPVVYNPHGETVGDVARWGLIPSWWKKDAPPAATFNARSEEAAKKPMWRSGMRSTRCLLPARGWYEWNEHEPVRTGSGRKGQQPYYFHDPATEVVAIAGLWSWWQSADGSEVLSCALLTREAPAGPIADIHHRMPVVLAPSEFPAWLSRTTSPRDVAAIVAGSRTDFAAHRVGTQVNNPRNESPDLIEEVPPQSGGSR